MKKLLLFFLISIPLLAFAQLEVPPSSATAHLETKIGLTNFTLDYHRPSVKGRVIFGELIPLGRVWRTGANEATTLRFDRAIVIDEQEIAAGTYALFTIPGEEEWVVIISQQTDLWGARGYEQAQDVLRVVVPKKALSERVETMELRWMNVDHNNADLVLEWEFTRVRLPIQVQTTEQVQASIAETLDDNAGGSDYYKAARYYLDNDLDLAQAKGWMDKRMELDGEQFGMMRYQAIIEKRLGNDEAAQKIMERSLALARERPNEHYVRMNKATLEEWTKRVADLSPTDIINRSIAYHDPKGAWSTRAHNLYLHESRPGGSYRLTNLTLNEGAGEFKMIQNRGKDLIIREKKDGEWLLFRNGQTSFTEDEQKRYRMSPAGSEVYPNYYNYLWGMPMKLRDEGTRLAETAHLVDYFGEELLEVRVTYTEEVGGDIWYFYFSPENYAMRGYRFYHDEADNDGEYILLEDEAEVDDMRIPAKRHWYTHGDRLYLGSDEIIQY